MIQTQTSFKLRDNSGVRIAKCIRIYRNRVGFINSIVLVSIQNVKFHAKVKKGDLLKGIIVGVKYKNNRKTGNSIAFDENSLVLLNKKNELYGTRIFGPIDIELRKKSLLKLLSLSSNFI